MRGVLATATLPDREFWEGTKTRARNGESSAESGFKSGITYIPRSVVRGDARYDIAELVFYADGVLSGILTYFPEDIPEDDTDCGYEGGTYVITVDPAKRRRGIGTALLKEMTSRWAVDFENQTYTDAGLALVQAFLCP